MGKKKGVESVVIAVSVLVIIVGIYLFYIKNIVLATILILIGIIGYISRRQITDLIS